MESGPINLLTRDPLDFSGVPELTDIMEIEQMFDCKTLVGGQRDPYRPDPQGEDPDYRSASMIKMLENVDAMQSINGLQCFGEYWMGWIDAADFNKFYVKYGHETRQGFVRKKNLKVGGDSKGSLKGQL